ncbi:hypothetical protein LWI28_004498 [Acer negundo]|uniref:X8 domain-containing protein n=1 Tax=Acer negundo TaxID=4023 RepID=A0AAD5IUR1_ACENE|nr:hypothetical protein LWI28_004498 [Acer negundo]
MAALLLLSLILATAGQSSATWCVCKEGVGESAMQKALDYACGAGADCGLIHTNGACFNPNTVKAHCNFAVNSYFQKKGQAQGSCDLLELPPFLLLTPVLLVVLTLQAPALPAAPQQHQVLLL